MTPTTVPLSPGSPGPAPRPRPTDPALLAVLRRLDADPRVQAASAALREASAELRWSQVLRRRWREARAEANLCCAVASGAVEGAVVPLGLLRERVARAELTQAASGDPALDAVTALWRAGTHLNELMPDLGGAGGGRRVPSRELLAGLHRDLVAPLVASGQLTQRQVAAPRRDGEEPLEGGPGQAPQGLELRARLEGLLDLLDLPQAPALVRAALVHAELVTARPFAAGNAALGRLLVRHLVVRDGLEPTGTAVAEAYPARAPQAYREAASAYASADPDGVAAWVVWQAEALLVGLEEAQVLLRRVQAGRSR
ncbi:Fic family protein [Actinomyces weissii]|uniref:Fic family protein n=1 Tax=Actinomyces weissii TaxID=675090 RepID=A0A7T7S213_9ACTO|nr:Fic family protein [Actinomyces weissii]QQM67200.1 Fic family protein [Actinomyces weissii]